MEQINEIFIQDDVFILDDEDENFGKITVCERDGPEMK